MKLVNIKYPAYFDDIEDIENHNIDIFVELDDGMTYTMVVTTPKNYYWYMDKEDIDYIPPAPPDIIVRKLTKDNIGKAVEAFLEENGYWFKLFYLAGKRHGVFDVIEMDRMIEEIKQRQKEIFG